jgi:hypothetical protein
MAEEGNNRRLIEPYEMPPLGSGPKIREQAVVRKAKCLFHGSNCLIRGAKGLMRESNRLPRVTTKVGCRDKIVASRDNQGWLPGHDRCVAWHGGFPRESNSLSHQITLVGGKDENLAARDNQSIRRHQDHCWRNNLGCYAGQTVCLASQPWLSHEANGSSREASMLMREAAIPISPVNLGCYARQTVRLARQAS